MQKPMIFIAGVLVGAVAVLTLSEVWAPAQVDVKPAESPIAQPPATLPGNADAHEPAAGSLLDDKQPPVATTSDSEAIEFTPAQLDELAEQRRERQERIDRSNMHLRYPAAYAGKYAAFQGNEYYADAVEIFESGETTSPWAERVQQSIQQFFDKNPEQFPQVRVECRATLCRIEGQVASVDLYDRYFSDPKNNVWPSLGLSFWGSAHHMVPNDSSNAFVLFKHKNDDDFKSK